ncbi:MAG: SDR family NAD(P)-dependent oxidoreductase, partial [Pseudomonadota bacterium]
MHVVVTGGARGIGAAVCRLLGEARCDVTFGYRADQVAADATVVAARAGGGRAKAVVADVTKEAQIVRLFDTAEAAFGPVTGVVANAAVFLLSCQSEAASISVLLGTSSTASWPFHK